MGAITHQPRPLSLVIPTWNGGPRFLQLLDVLDQQDVPGGFQLVVVDSTSRDGTPEAARARGALVHQIPQSEFGHGKTRNLGLSLAAGRVVALLTQDAVPMDRHVGAYYLRLMVVDRPGVIADVTAVLRDHGVSLESMLQRGRAPGEAVPVVLVTHDCEEAAMRAALARIAALGAVLEKPALIRIEPM